MPIAVALAAASLLAAAPAPSPSASPAPDARVDALLARMTDAEKIGQLVQWSGDDASKSFDDDVRHGAVGSFLNVTGAARVGKLQHLAVDKSRLGIPLLFAHDVIHGFRTVFPVPLAEASSFDPALVEKSAAVAAREATAVGVRWVFAPMVDVARDPRWGRIVEGSGEDPFLGAQLAAARVRGFQGASLADPTSAVACPKHFAGYGRVEGGRDYAAVDVSERTLREVVFPPFKAAIDAGALTIMAAFNDLDGTPCSANRWLLGGVLRAEWKYDGIVVSDWDSVAELIPHGVAGDGADAARQALLAGVDVDMHSGLYAKHLAALLASGAIPRDVLDASVRRVLRLKEKLGLFDHPFPDPKREKSDVLTAANRMAARAMADESIVLLRDEHTTLPLAPGLATLALIGPLADDAAAPIGPWANDGSPKDTVTILAGLKEALPHTAITLAKGCGVDAAPTDDADIAAAASVAKAAGAAVLVLGESPDMSGEASSRASLDLPGSQEKLLEAVVATGVPVTLVLLNGRPLTIGWAAEHVPAIVEAWYPGIEAGHAIADVLTGVVNPSGRLPITFPRTVGQIPIYAAMESSGRPTGPGKYTTKYRDLPSTPLWPFGFGLSYTTFAYRDLTASKPAGGRVTVSVDVANTGARDGDEVVQLYLHEVVSSTTRPMRALKGFRRVHLAAGAHARVELTLGPDELGHLDRDLKPVVEPGRYEIFVGGLEGSFEIPAD